MNFDFLLIIKFNKLYIFMLKNIKQECVFNAISISLSVINNLNHLITATQHSEFIIKLFLKSLISSVISTEINDMKTLIKAMKTMIFVITVITF